MAFIIHVEDDGAGLQFFYLTSNQNRKRANGEQQTANSFLSPM
jgi:hypothetical protein